MKNIVTNATLWFLLSFISAACLVSLNYPNISPREKYLSDYLNQQDFFVLFMGASITMMAWLIGIFMTKNT